MQRGRRAWWVVTAPALEPGHVGGHPSRVSWARFLPSLSLFPHLRDRDSKSLLFVVRLNQIVRPLKQAGTEGTQPCCLLLSVRLQRRLRPVPAPCVALSWWRGRRRQHESWQGAMGSEAAEGGASQGGPLRGSFLLPAFLSRSRSSRLFCLHLTLM